MRSFFLFLLCTALVTSSCSQTSLTAADWQSDLRFLQQTVHKILNYVLDEGEVSFAVGAYDLLQPLIIDPMLSYSTVLGGGDSDEGFGIAVDGAGHTYVTGRTFPARR